MRPREDRSPSPFVPKNNQRLQKGWDRCVYDWGSNSWTLECSTRGHSHPCIIVMDRFGAGSGLLVALLDEGMLSGAALIDATKVVEDRRFLEGL